MKKIGIIGGIGPESSIEYYRLIIKRYQERLETKEYPEILINSINMTEMLNYVFNNQFDQLIDFMVEKIKVLEKTDPDYIAIASNTPHIVFDRIASEVSTPLLNIVEATCCAISKKGINRAALLGTRSTMTGGFYNRVAEKHGISIVTPTPETQDYIHTKYMGELLFNNIVPETRMQLIRIIRGLQEKESINAVILGGTELPLIIKQSDFDDIEVFDTTVIHVESIVDKMIS